MSFAEFGLLPLFGVGETGKGNCNVGNGSSNGGGPISEDVSAVVELG
ncbi:MAG: hypothetical protein LC749_09000 [Actinobacteria bacterium]|nr:hypothetical protein [Actinomycetota bacterium]